MVRALMGTLLDHTAARRVVNIYLACLAPCSKIGARSVGTFFYWAQELALKGL